MGKFTEFLNKKVAGIKVLYLALVAVLILGYYAWRTTRNSQIDSATESGAEAGTPAEAAGDSVYPPLESGTVYVATPPAVDVTGDSEVDTNDAWGRRAVAWLMNNGYTGTEAQGIVQRYLAGTDMTWQQGQAINRALSALGTPPDSVEIGTVAARPSGTTSTTQPTAGTGKDTTRTVAAQNVSGISRAGAKVGITVSPGSAGASSVTEYQTRVSGDNNLDGSDRTYSSKTSVVDIKFGYPDKAYYIASRVKNGAGWGRWSPVKAVRSGK